MSPNALAVKIEGLAPICIACAEQMATESGYVTLWWLSNKPQPIDGGTLCGCGARMNSGKAVDAAERVTGNMRRGEVRKLCANETPEAA